MKLPRTVSGNELVKSLQKIGYRVVRQKVISDYLVISLQVSIISPFLITIQLKSEHSLQSSLMLLKLIKPQNKN